MLCPRQPLQQPSLGMGQGDTRTAPHSQPAAAERGAVRPHLKAAPAPWPVWVQGVTNEWEVCFQVARQIPIHDLAVKEVLWETEELSSKQRWL